MIDDISKYKKYQETNITLAKKIYQKEKSKTKFKELSSALQAKNEWLHLFITTLMRLSKTYVHAQLDFDTSLFGILNEARKVLETHQVSFWIYDYEKDAIIRKCLATDASDMPDISSITLYAKHFPRYFTCIKKEETIVASNARKNPATSEYLIPYLIPNKIYSMLDQPVFDNAKLAGIICIEHKYRKRNWKIEDAVFATGLADLITIALQYNKIKQDQNRIEQQQIEIQSQIEELLRQQEKIQTINSSLIKLVEERNALIAQRERQISDYAHINAHQLRAPFCRLKGLLHLHLNYEFSLHESAYIQKSLRKSILELESIVDKISALLNEEL